MPRFKLSAISNQLASSARRDLGEAGRSGQSANSNHASIGFSLIEIIVSITIIILIAAIAIPGLRSFNETQILEGETSKFATAIKQAQSYAQTNFQPITPCAPNTILSWTIKFFNTPKYELGWTCTDNTGAPTYTKLNSIDLSSGLSYTSDCGTTNQTINFSRNIITFSCATANLTITIANSAIGQNRVITITPGGSISVTSP